ncbi:uncharacterized protein [Gossypium hirsutum]|uniref:Uncharacterized protein n=1 Tax=Gossypium hirsutum TaxID=3635 RepID=A0A1U8KGV9_GOSHI|nr:uncharacterized protein LOC107915289 [Gossypium hirsutum]
MLSVVEERVGKVEESMEDAKESDNAPEESIKDLREQSKDFVTMCLTSQRDSNGLKPWVRQEVEQRGVQKLSEVMTVVESVVMLGLGTDKLGSSKSEERGVCEMNHKEDIVDGNGNGNNGGNGKPRVGKKKPKRKRDKLKCFLCDGPHMLKKCQKKFALKEKLVDKALVLGLSARGVKAKEAETEKKPVQCFLVRIGCGSVRGSLSSRGTMEQTRSP